MDKDEALKMAIEYIKESEFRPLKGSVLALLKEALAEAENESNSQPVAFNGKDYMEGFNAGKMFAELEHTAQEPVAIVMEDSYGYGASLYKRLPLGTKLYTHPAQPLTRDWIGTALERADKDEAFRKGLIGELAQPLSDDEITEILVKHGLDNVEMAGNHIDVVLLMRDVERAHGIGVKE
jgi:hypothetical protein